MLVTGNAPGNDLRFHFERLDGARNFVNKIWNASRFALMNLQDYAPDKLPEREQYTLADCWIVSRYQRAVRECTAFLGKYELGEAARVLYEFIWNELCDWYIELVKPRLYGKTGAADREVAQHVLASVLRGALELLHPFMPFITEEIWQRLPHRGTTIMRAPWPEYHPEQVDGQAEESMEIIMEVIRGIRQIRSEMNVPPGKQAEALIVTAVPALREVLAGNVAYIEGLANCQVNVLAVLNETPEQAATAVARDIQIFVPLRGLIDIEKELVRLSKDKLALAKDLARVEGKLNNPSFMDKAPDEVIVKERGKQAELSSKLAAINERLVMFGAS